MHSFALTVILTLGGLGQVDYKDAYDTSSAEQGQMVVLIEKPFCFGCLQMKKKLSYLFPAHVQMDGMADKRARQIMVTSPDNPKMYTFPQLHIFRRKAGVWTHKFLIGDKPESEITRFLNE